MADQRQRRGGMDLADHGDEIRKIVLKLPEIDDVAAGAGCAMTANIGR